MGSEEPQMRHYGQPQSQQQQYIMQQRQQEPHFVGLRHLPQTYATSRPDDDLNISGGTARPQDTYLPVGNSPLYPTQEYWPGGTTDPTNSCLMPNVTTLPNRDENNERTTHCAIVLNNVHFAGHKLDK
ncbi:unnamed protein product [Dibothriocephalus latus]|uniref:Uncharacterized protein n=1 Tax=Dibothriocephalus latus TaxID=60516 RepID=A0A3P7MFF6_DIBLA|nr:unnamed protein product [Dibothriocephalus latus]